MKIRTATGQILHVEKSPVTQILIDAGLARIVTEVLPPVTSLTTWEFGFPNEAVDTKHVEVRLEARCSNRRCITRRQLFYGCTAGRTAKFAHCGRVDSCPADIAKAYEKARERAQKD